MGTYFLCAIMVWWLYIYIFFLKFPLSFKIYTEIFMSEILRCLIFASNKLMLGWTHTCEYKGNRSGYELMVVVGNWCK